MPDPTTPAWGLRLADLLGGRPDQISEEHLQRLVTGGVREDADLDFKRERYGNSDAEKRELAADIASMANHRGGLIIIGVREENEVAVELTPVLLDASEELRLTQTAASNIAPHLTFAIEVARSASESSRGYYLLTVPPSTLRPHAVRSGRNLGFPVRDGPTKRWLSESELADAYRDRYRLATDQVSRATQILTEGLEMMDRESGALLGLAMVPTGQGSMAIDLARVRAFEQWIRDLGAAVRFDGFFDPAGSPTGSVAAHRVTMNLLWDSNRPRRSEYAEFFDDGAGFACTHIFDARGPHDEYEEICVLDETLIWDVGRCLHLVGQHAARNCGAFGDALVEARLISGAGQAMRLVFLQRVPAGLERVAEIARGRALGTADGRRTIVIEAVATIGADLAVATRLLATELFHAFGSPEVPQIAPDGALRLRHLGGDGALRTWAEQHGIAVSDEIVAGG
jgi:hypothetical protein